MAEQKSSYTYEEILTCSSGEMFGPGNAQLPAPPMLMVNRITEISETGGEHNKGCIRMTISYCSDQSDNSRSESPLGETGTTVNIYPDFNRNKVSRTISDQSSDHRICVTLTAEAE